MADIFLDHASTTPVDPIVLKEMLPWFSKNFANPDSLHTPGIRAKKALDSARKNISQILNCEAGEIIFSSGGSESNNLAIFGLSEKHKNGHIITSSIEHSSVLEAVKKLGKKGFEITYLKPDKQGIINPTDLEKAIRENTILVSIIFANNEIGTIQDIEKLGKICQKENIPFHTDACQAIGDIAIDLEKLPIDLLTLNSSKIYGPKGVGALFIRKNKITNIPSPQLLGGDQEFGLRAGTSNVPGIMGFAKALELAEKNRLKETKRLTALRDNFIDQILKKIAGTKLNGHPKQRLANNVNLYFPKVEGKYLLLQLDHHGIACSTGSACHTHADEASHVLTAIGLKAEEARGSLRFTLGKSTTQKDLNYVIMTLQKILEKIR